ncbi:MAG: hydroxyacid dehydrogenase [Ruminococcaceae bacterium]|nr:hydroxyacid dehydrogenase [Oscillospiraceae bacterium]
MKISVLDSLTLGGDLDLSPLKKYGELKIYSSTDTEETPSHCMDSDILVINKVKINENTLPDPGKVKLICLFATGFDNVDINYCQKHSIALCNVVGYSTDSVAQLTCALVLNLSCRISEFSDHVTSGDYTKGGVANYLVPVYNELMGKKWGIIGLGNIGKRVAKVAEAFGCKVLVNKRTPSDEYENTDIDTLCKESDIITIHTPLTDETRHLIDEKRLSLMKKNVILVNVARGLVTDEGAVAKAVKEGRIGAFGCDVFSTEPFGNDHPFTEIMHLPNVCLTPHMAWGAYEARMRCLDEICKNIESFITHGTRNRLDI